MSVGEIVLIAADLAVALLLAVWFTGLYFGIKRLVKPDKRTVDYLVEYEIEEKGLDRAITGIPFEQMFRTSRFGYELAARFYACEGSSKTVVCLHGHNSCFASQLKYLPIFLSLGYNVFIPDHRRSGLSGGDTVTFGAYEKHDVLDWISELRAGRPDDSIALFGESMGAATAIMVAAEIPDAVFLIDYCGYANFEGLLTRYTDNEGITPYRGTLLRFRRKRVRRARCDQKGVLSYPYNAQQSGQNGKLQKRSDVAGSGAAGGTAYFPGQRAREKHNPISRRIREYRKRIRA